MLPKITSYGYKRLEYHVIIPLILVGTRDFAINFERREVIKTQIEVGDLNLRSALRFKGELNRFLILKSFIFHGLNNFIWHSE